MKLGADYSVYYGLRRLLAILLFFLNAGFDRAAAAVVDCDDWPRMRTIVERYARSVSGVVLDPSPQILVVKSADADVLIKPVNMGNGSCMGILLLADWVAARSLKLEEYVKLQNELFPLKLRPKEEKNPSEMILSRGIVMMGGMSEEMFEAHFAIFFEKLREMRNKYRPKGKSIE
jgi:hypothetical protein